MSAVMADPGADAARIRRPRRKLILVGAVALMLVLGLGAAAVVALKQRAAHAAAAGNDEGSPDLGGAVQSSARTAPIYLPLDPFVVNLADREADRYAQIGFTLELDSGVSGDQVRAYMPAIRNAILMILANKSSRELLSREGKEQLADDIMREAARSMGIEVRPLETARPLPVDGATSVASVSKAFLRGVEAQRNPIQHVHFSSFIIQ